MPKVNISDNLREQIVEEAKKRVATPPDKDEITATMLAKEISSSNRQARIILNDMVEDGLATMRENGVGGCKVYKIKENK